jgi:hypothetical protein
MFTVHRPTLPAKTVQVECPACGSHNTNVSVHWQDPRTGQLLQDRYGMDPLHGLAIVLVSGAISFLVTGVLFGPDSTCLAIALTALLSIGIITAYTLRSLKQQENAVRVHRYECQYCRHTWTWQEGTPVPRYNRQREIWQDYQEVFGHPPDET